MLMNAPIAMPLAPFAISSARVPLVVQ